MKILVCGGRNYDQRDRVFQELDWLGPSLVVTGGCLTGADMLAERWAYERGVACRRYEVSTEEWLRRGKKAGPLRNQRMLDSELSGLALVLAFPGNNGTNDMVRKARAAGVPVRSVP